MTLACTHYNSEGFEHKYQVWDHRWRLGSGQFGRWHRFQHHCTGAAPYSPCFCHTIQLIVNDGFKEAGQLNRVLGKVPKVFNHVHKSTIATDRLEGQVRMQAGNVTRWNSQVKMILTVPAVPAVRLDRLNALAITVQSQHHDGYARDPGAIWAGNRHWTAWEDHHCQFCHLNHHWTPNSSNHNEVSPQ